MIKLGIKLISIFLVSKIKVVEFRNYIEELLEPIEKVAEVLTDKDPNNTTQLLEIWNDNKNDIINGSLPTACLIIKKRIKDPMVAQIICEMIKDEMDSQTQT